MAAVTRPRLRIGVFADADRQPRWMVEALARVAAAGHAELSCVVLPRSGEQAAAPMLWRAYTRIDEALFARANRSEPRDVAMLVPRERRVELDAAGGWRSRVGDARLDVAFVLGDIADEVLEGVARFGTWRYCFGDSHGSRETLAGVREVIAAHPVMASGIRIHPGQGRPDRIACQSWARTYEFSPAKSRDALFAKSGEFLARALRDLRDGGMEWLERGTEPAGALGREDFPGAAALLRDISRLGARVAKRAAQKALTVDTWSIAYRFSADSADWSGSLEGFHRLDPPKGWYWADPFPIQVGGRNYIFFEELPLGAAKAHISVVEVDREGRASAPVKVLERDYHLSYPFLVEEDGQLYMIPETAQNNTVEVYRCIEFPTRWALERVLLQGVFCCDATLHREGDKWWMFANSAADESHINDELHIFSSDSLLGEWKPHRRNPVKSDVRSARPTGRLFRHGERVSRPGQICTPLYGSGVALHRVTRLTQDEYREVEDRRIEPKSEAVLGIHTINRSGDLMVTDAFSRARRF